jgi:hypothetical protein
MAVLTYAALFAKALSEDLVGYMLEQGHERLFTGIFGHKRIVAWVLGNTAQYLLHTCPGPMMLCHVTSLLMPESRAKEAV